MQAQCFALCAHISRRPKFDSGSYWEARYARGGDSGSGSHGELASYKAGVLNRIVATRNIRSVVELGCGDGRVLRLVSYPAYLGFDVSHAILSVVRKQFASDKTKRFLHMDDHNATAHTADLALSLDVIYHLVEDHVYEQYMRRLFVSALHFVVVYASNKPVRAMAHPPVTHVRHREFTSWVEANQPAWRLVEHERNPYSPQTPASFFVYGRLNVSEHTMSPLTPR
eukprot:2445641-Prymnesium_polylepis.1